MPGNLRFGMLTLSVCVCVCVWMGAFINSEKWVEVRFFFSCGIIGLEETRHYTGGCCGGGRQILLQNYANVGYDLFYNAEGQ